MANLSERALRRMTWTWTVLWVASLFAAGAVLGTSAAVGVFALGIAGTYAIDRLRRRREDLDRHARIAGAVPRRPDQGSADPAPSSVASSIFDHLQRHLPPPGQALDAAGLLLPDEPAADGRQLRWAPGARDGVAVYHASAPADDAAVDRVFELVVAGAADVAGPPATQALEDAVTGSGALPVVDPLLERLRERVGTAGGPSVEGLHRLARTLATRSGRREAAKLGISLLGVVSHPSDVAVVTTLGRHDEFTLYAAVALRAILPDPGPVLFELARGVRGWGRIHVVTRLSDTADPAIRDWIVREGFRNEVMDEYLAPIAARTGRLADRLADDPDEALVDSACDIVAALINPGPTAGMAEVPDGSRILDLLLSLIAVRPMAPARLVVADGIDRFLADEGGPWAAGDGWAPPERAGLRARCRQIRERPGWRERIEADLVSPDPAIAATARQAARSLGMDTFDAVLAGVRADPLGVGWYELLELTDGTRIETVVALASETLPLDAIATGPGLELGLGPGWEPHRALDAILQGLARFPGHGWPLVRAGIASPVIRNRNQALRALEAWDRGAWPADAGDLLRRAATDEPDDRVREVMLRLLA